MQPPLPTRRFISPGGSYLPQRRGFTFAEVLFAVILLGIGFIMLAGMFPVAISQTQTNLDETTAANLASAAARVISEHATEANMPSTIPPGFPFAPARFQRLRTIGSPPNDDLWELIKGTSISDTDPRYAWTAVYRRKGNEKVAELAIFVVKAQDYDRYADGNLRGTNTSDVYGGTNATGKFGSLVNYPATYEPRMVDVQVYFGETVNTDIGQPDVAAIYRPILPSGDPYENEFDGYDFVGEGCYIVVASDPSANLTVGSVYRLGRKLDGRPSYMSINPGGGSGDVSYYELLPGNDMTDRNDNIPLTGGGPLGKAYVIGKGWHERPDPKSGAPKDIGDRVQDVGVYITFIQIRGN
jgi:type II secretory pathway pseudopilin PulG